MSLKSTFAQELRLKFGKNDRKHFSHSNCCFSFASRLKICSKKLNFETLKTINSKFGKFRRFPNPRVLLIF